MPERLQLIGEIDTRDQDIERLEAEIDRLEGELRLAQMRADQLEKANARAIGNLRRTLSPLYQSLQMVFGQIDAMGIEDAPAPSAAPLGMDARKAAVWESWKRKLGGKQAEFIAALMEHGELTPIQLKTITHSGSSTVSETIAKLRDLGLINKNGAKCSLKEL